MKNVLFHAFTTFALITCFAVPAWAQKLSTEEQKLVQYVDAHANEAVALLEKVVNIESPTQNIEGVKKVGLVFKSEFDALGLATKWIEMPAEMKRAGHLLAETSGTKG
ncbi:MAG TPA: M20 family peptidase, partial [Blastocatellia bacterium]|nr:M20 family peptidase [Blastocatellia bacterium]